MTDPLPFQPVGIRKERDADEVRTVLREKSETAANTAGLDEATLIGGHAVPDAPGAHADAAGDEQTVIGSSASAAGESKGVPGFLIPGYELLGELGRGGMGVVFKARQLRPSRLVALKTINAPQVAGQEQIARFQSEAQAAGQLDHRGIVPVFEVGEHQGIHYFSMGYVDGGSLENLCRETILQCRRAAEICSAVAESLSYAHLRGVIHRDIKPHNILIGTDGSPRITDFGLAKLAGDQSDLTGSGQIMGTASYMPPEQAAGHTANAGPSADIYALGATLYRCVTGRPPFQAGSTLEVLRQVIDEEPLAPCRLNPDVDTDLQTIILKCLEKNPAQRFASAQELHEELQRYLNGEPIHARPAGRIERCWRWCRRRPYVAASLLLGAFAFVSIVGGVPLVLLQQQRLQSSELQRLAQQDRDAALLEKSKAREAEATAEKLRAAAIAAEELNRRQLAEQLAAANAARAATQEYHAKIRGVRELRSSREPGWTWAASRLLNEAKALDADGKDELELRSLEAELLLTSDVRLLPQDVTERESKGDTAKGKQDPVDTPAVTSGTAGEVGELPSLWGTGEDYSALDVSRDGMFLAAAETRGAPVSSVHLYEIPEQPATGLKHVRTLSISTVADKLKSLLKSTGVTSTSTPGYRSVRFSPDGHRVAAGTRGGNVVLWNLNQDSPSPYLTVTVAKRDPPGEIRQIEFSPDGQTLFAWAHNETQVHCLSVETGQPICEPISAHRFAVLLDGTVSATEDQWIRGLTEISEKSFRQISAEDSPGSLMAFDGHQILAGLSDHQVHLGNARTMQLILSLDQKADPGFADNFPGWMSQAASWIAIPAEADSLGIWDTLSGEFIVMLPPGMAKWTTGAVCQKTSRLFVHGDLNGHLFEFRRPETFGPEAKIHQHNGSSVEEVGCIAYEAAANTVRGFSVTPDESHVFTAEQNGTSHVLIRRLNLQSGVEENRWVGAWVGADLAPFAHVDGSAVACLGDTGKVILAGAVPGGFAECSDRGLHLFQTPWGPNLAGTTSSVESTDTVIRLPAVTDSRDGVEYRPTISLFVPREFRPGTERLILRTTVSGKTEEFEVDARTLTDRGWYLLQLGAISSEDVKADLQLGLRIEAQNLVMTPESGSTTPEDLHRNSSRQPTGRSDELFIQFAGLCPVRLNVRSDYPRKIGPVATDSEGVISGILDENILLRWTSASDEPFLQWQDAVNDFAHFGTVAASRNTTLVGTTKWMGHMYAFTEQSNSINSLQRQARSQYQSSEAIQSLAITADQTTAIAGNLLGEAIVCRLNEATNDVSKKFDVPTLDLESAARWSITRTSAHRSPVTAVAIDRTGRSVATGSLTGELRLWDCNDGQLSPRLVLKLTTRPIRQLAFTSSGLIMLREGDRAIRKLNIIRPSDTN